MNLLEEGGEAMQRTQDLHKVKIGAHIGGAKGQVYVC